MDSRPVFSHPVSLFLRILGGRNYHICLSWENSGDGHQCVNSLPLSRQLLIEYWPLLTRIVDSIYDSWPLCVQVNYQAFVDVIKHTFLTINRDNVLLSSEQLFGGSRYSLRALRNTCINKQVSRSIICSRNSDWPAWSSIRPYHFSLCLFVIPSDGQSVSQLSSVIYWRNRRTATWNVFV